MLNFFRLFLFLLATSQTRRVCFASLKLRVKAYKMEIVEEMRKSVAGVKKSHGN